MVSTPKRESLLEVRDLRVRYGDANTALAGVDLDVAPGEVVALLGSNGAGKSTLLNAVSGLIPSMGGSVASGTVAFRDRAVTHADPSEIVRAGLVQVPEGRRIFGQLSVAENLTAGGLTVRNGSSLEAARARVLDLFPVLADRATMRAGLMSGGEQQMLAIGRALMSSPALLMLDEPSLGLAPQVVDRIAEVVTEIRNNGTAVLIVEQNVSMALSIADRALLLENGRVAKSGPVAEFDHGDELVGHYLGASAQERPKDGAAGGKSGGAEPLLSVRSVSVQFGGVRALDDVSFDVRPGDVHAVIGPNGAGKSTLFNALTRVVPLHSGEVHHRGERIDHLAAHRLAARGIARSFQNIVLMPEQTVEENLLVGCFHHGRAGLVSTALRLPAARREEQQQRAQVRRVAEHLGLDGQLQRRVGELPYGVKKRIELGRALCAEPELMLLDEPAAGMNAEETQELAQRIAAIKTDLDVTIILVEHDMGFVMGLADRVTVLDFGQLLITGTPDEVRRDDRVIAAYLGRAAESEEASAVSATVDPRKVP